MGLNGYRDEAGQFLGAIHAAEEPIEEKIRLLQQELDELKTSLQEDKIRHQLYDLLFLVFELAAQMDADLDLEWRNGRVRKREKYL